MPENNHEFEKIGVQKFESNLVSFSKKSDKQEEIDRLKIIDDKLDTISKKLDFIFGNYFLLDGQFKQCLF